MPPEKNRPSFLLYTHHALQSIFEAPNRFQCCHLMMSLDVELVIQQFGANFHKITGKVSEGSFRAPSVTVPVFALSIVLRLCDFQFRGPTQTSPLMRKNGPQTVKVH